jgi:hypothetical protein
VTATRRGRFLCAAGSFSSALIAVGGVFGALPARWAPVDVTTVLVAVACAASGGLWIANARIAERVARIVSAAVLVIGLLLVLVLAGTASYLSGVYGAVGKGGAMVLAFVAVLAVPYLVALPAAQLLYLRRAAPSVAPEEKAE